MVGLHGKNATKILLQKLNM